MNGWGLPDWRDAEAYEPFGGWDESRWRWEFLRRRGDYREDFEAALKQLDLPLKTPEDCADVAGWLTGLGMRAWPFMHPDARKYGLTEFFDPVIGNWIGLGPEWNSGLIFGASDGRELFVGDDREYHFRPATFLVDYSFDLRRPLPPQIAELTALLQQSQFEYFAYGDGMPEGVPLHEAERLAIDAPPKTKHHRRNWPTYLRVLDAREAGASLSEIAEILPGSMAARDEQAAHNVLGQAKALQFRF